MWLFNIRFDTKFFAISMCMLSHLRSNVVHQFTIAIRGLVHYMAAQKRIRVCFQFLFYEEKKYFFFFRDFFY